MPSSEAQHNCLILHDRLIAIMLGRLRMTIGEALSTFREIAAELFSKRRSLVPLATKYHHEPFEYLMGQIVKH
jgi:hypothetical protein